MPARPAHRRAPAGHAWGVAGVWLLCASAATAHAQAVDLKQGPPGLPATGAVEPGTSRGVLWNPLNEQSRLSLGVAVGQRTLPTGQVWSPSPLTGSAISGAQAAGQASMVVGVGLTAPRAGAVSAARLVWQTPVTQRSDLASAPDPSATSPDGVPQRMRVGLVLRPADPLAELRGGALTKVQLSGQMALSLRPRAGGVWLSLNGKW